MPHLVVEGRIFEADLPGLGSRTPFLELSEKRVTKAVRQCLRGEFGPDRDDVTVSCAAHPNGRNQWTGRCRLKGGAWLSYRIDP